MNASMPNGRVCAGLQSLLELADALAVEVQALRFDDAPTS
jgi:hypothetical protein